MHIILFCGFKITDVKNVIIWGNHSSTQFPDIAHATVNKGGKTMKASEAVNDNAWVQGPFISVRFYCRESL